MAIAVVHAALVAASPVTALVPVNNIEPLRRTQAIGIPAITMQIISDTPNNHLLGDGHVDANLVQIDCWDDDYDNLLLIAAASRTALYAAGYQMQNGSDGYEPETDPELYRISQTWSVFT